MRALLFAIPLLAMGCGEEAVSPRPEPPPGDRSAGRETPSAPTAPPAAKRPEAAAGTIEARHADPACEAAEAGAAPLELVKVQLTSNVEEREPVDELAQARVGEHVWAYLEIANTSGGERCVSVTFRVDGGKRAALTLDVGPSPRWRTWAKNRIVEADAGKSLEIEIRDDQERVLETRTLPIAKAE